VFDHIEAGRFAEQPAREHAGVLLLAALADIDLHEGAGLLRHLPGCGALARRKPDDHRPDLAHLAGFEDDILRDIVALVEQADRRHALRHRGRPAAGRIGGCDSGGGGRRGIIERDALRFRRTRIVAGGKTRSADQQRGKAGEPHRADQASVLPGVHAS
jgi:hypothetical protein